MNNQTCSLSNICWKLTKEISFSNLIVQTSFAHYLILKLGFQISKLQFCTHLSFSKFMHTSGESWSFCPTNDKMAAGRAFLFGRCYWIILRTKWSLRKSNIHQSSDCIGTIVLDMFHGCCATMHCDIVASQSRVCCNILQTAWQDKLCVHLSN